MRGARIGAVRPAARREHERQEKEGAHARKLADGVGERYSHRATLAVRHRTSAP